MGHAFLTGCLLVGALMVAGATPASAQEMRRDNATANRATVGLSLGYGFRVTDDGDLDDDANPYGVGLGIRGGYTLEPGLYLGGLFNYFWGESVGNDTVNGRINQMNVAADIGFDIGLGERAVLRPVLAVGATIVTGEVCVLGSCSDDQSDPYLLLAPGVQLIVAFDGVFVGGEARYFFLPDDESPDGLLFAGNVGAIF